MKPSIGRVVHYTSYGTPGGEYGKECRAAIVTQVGSYSQCDSTGRVIREVQTVGLAVLNPTGMFFNPNVEYNAGSGQPGDPECLNPHADGPHRYCPCGWAEPAPVGGTWHWPERTD